MGKKYVTGCRFINAWLSQFKRVYEANLDEDDEEIEGGFVKYEDPSKSPLTLPSFVALVKQLLDAHLTRDSSGELLCSLLEVL